VQNTNQSDSDIGDVMVLLVGCPTCESQVADWCPASALLHSGIGQAAYTYVLLSPSSVIWYLVTV